MEAIVGPQYWDHWDKFGMRPALQALRSEAGEAMVLRDNFFIEADPAEGPSCAPSPSRRWASTTAVREPGEGRRPTLTWPRQIPIEGEPADVVAIAAAYADWLATKQCAQAVGEGRARWDPRRRRGSRLRPQVASADEVTVAGVHFVQEDSPDEIGRAIAAGC